MVVGASRKPNVNRLKGCVFFRPAKLSDTSGGSARRSAEKPVPLGSRHGFASGGNGDVVATVPCLFSARYPFAVVGTVPSVIVNAFNAIIAIWHVTHV